MRQEKSNFVQFSIQGLKAGIKSETIFWHPPIERWVLTKDGWKNVEQHIITYKTDALEFTAPK